jgi:hypothetical protein
MLRSQRKKKGHPGWTMYGLGNTPLIGTRRFKPPSTEGIERHSAIV